MEHRLTAEEAWNNAQLVIGRVAILDYILDRIKQESKQGYTSLLLYKNSTQPPQILELFRNSEKLEFIIDVLQTLGYQIDHYPYLEFPQLYIRWKKPL